MCLAAVSLACEVAWAEWSAASVPGGNGASSAATVNQGATPTASVAGSAVTVGWAASTLSNGTAVSGYVVKRYDAVAPFAPQTILTACTGTVTATTCTENSTPDGQWAYSVTPVFATSWTGAESLKSSPVTVDTTPPTVTGVSSTLADGHYKAGQVVPVTATFSENVTVTGTPKLTLSTGTPATTAVDYTSGTGTNVLMFNYTVAAGNTSADLDYAATTSLALNSGTIQDLATNNATLTLAAPAATNSLGANKALVIDTTAPTTGTVSYLDGKTTSTSVSVSFTTGTDGGSGIGTRLLQRRSATLTGTTCGSYGSLTNVATNPTSSPYVDTVSRGACYQYQYVTSDNAGNQGTAATNTNVVTVPTYYDFIKDTAGLLSYWRLGESAGTSITDSKGTNTGTYYNTPTLEVAGAITGDPNTAATFTADSSEYGSVAREIFEDFSIEFWFKSTQGIGTSDNWYGGAGLVDAEVTDVTGDFGVSLRGDGKVVAGVGGGSDISIVSTSGAYNDGAWHHVVFTRTRSSGALQLYVDGVSVGTATGSTVLLTTPANINFGRIQTGRNYLEGSLDEVAVYDTSLSAATVTAHYSAAQ